jgi:hypothetical protein
MSGSEVRRGDPSEGKSGASPSQAGSGGQATRADIEAAERAAKTPATPLQTGKARSVPPPDDVASTLDEKG